MGNFRSRSSKLPTPKPIRFPLMDDKLVQDTRAKTTRAALSRQGRQGTFLSNIVRSMTGSGGRLGR